MTFQQTVNIYPSQGREATLATGNPTATAVSPEGGFKAGSSGLYLGRFAWVDGTDNTLLNNTGTGLPLGFLMNTGKAVIPLGETASMAVMAGTDTQVMTMGDFWVKTTTIATIGQKIFAVLADGTIKTGAAGATISGAIETPFAVVSLGGNSGIANSLIIMSKWGL